MTIEELIIYGKKHLPSNEAKMLLAFVTGYDTLELLNYLDERIDTSKIEKYYQLIEARKANYPLQYIIGSISFLGLDIAVNENVLIPRFETEDLVYRTIQYINKYFSKNKTLSIVDLGTGSGCIAIALKKAFPLAIVDAVDISSEAINLAKKNARKNKVNINFYLGNMLDPLDRKYDIIISNPPYIDKDEQIEEIVLKNEPHLALFAPNKGLYYYEEILNNSIKYLNKNSMIAFEIGYKQGQWIKKYAKKVFPQSLLKLEKDLANKDRFIFIYNEF